MFLNHWKNQIWLKSICNRRNQFSTPYVRISPTETQSLYKIKHCYNNKLNKNYHNDLNSDRIYLYIFVNCLKQNKITESNVAEGEKYIKQHYLPYHVSQIYECPKRYACCLEIYGFERGNSSLITTALLRNKFRTAILK